MLCLGTQFIGPGIAREVLTNFQNATFNTEEQFCRRVRKLDVFDYGIIQEIKQELLYNISDIENVKKKWMKL